MTQQRIRATSMDIREEFAKVTSEFDQNRQRMAEILAQLGDVCEKTREAKKVHVVSAISATGAGVGTTSAGVGGALVSGMLTTPFTGGMLGAATGISAGVAAGLTIAGSLASGGILTGAALAGIYYYRKKGYSQTLAEAETLMEELTGIVRRLQDNTEAFRSLYDERNKNTDSLVLTQTRIQDLLEMLQNFMSEKTIERLLVVCELCRGTVEEMEQLRSHEDFLSFINS